MSLTFVKPILENYFSFVWFIFIGGLIAYIAEHLRKSARSESGWKRHALDVFSVACAFIGIRGILFVFCLLYPINSANKGMS